MTVSEMIVLAARTIHRELFGTDLSPGTESKVRRCIRQGQSIESVLQQVMQPEKMRGLYRKKARVNSKAIYHFRDMTQDPEILQRLFEKSGQYWRGKGSDPDTIYYSVISDEKNRKVLSKEERREFLEGGALFLKQCDELLAERGVRDLGKLSALDFGCGVGRLSFHAAKRFGKVVAVDFSQGHLAELRENFREFGSELIGELETVLLSNLTDAENLPKVDFVFSLIALQHSTPPVMGFLTEQLLRALKPGGYAAIQFPLYIADYEFGVQDYLEDPKAGTHMEMHILPRRNLKEIATRCGCTIVESFGHGTRSPYSELFLIQRTE